MSRARNPLQEFVPNSQGTIAKLVVRESLTAPQSFVDGITITGDGSPGNPLVANVASAVVDVDGVTIQGDGSPDEPLHLAKVFVDAGYLQGLGTAADPLTLTQVAADLDTIEGLGTYEDPLKLKKVYATGNVFGTGTAADPLDALAQSDDDTIEGDGGSANPFKLKKVYVGDGISGDGTAANPLTAEGSSPTYGIAVAVAGFAGTVNVSENAGGTARSVDWFMHTGSSEVPSVAGPRRAGFTSQQAAYRYGNKSLLLTYDWYQGNNGLFAYDSGNIGGAALTSYAGEGWPSSSAIQGATQGRGFSTNYSTGHGFSVAVPADPFAQMKLDLFVASKKCVVTYFATLQNGTSVTGSFGTVAEGDTARKVTLTFTGGGMASICFIVTNLTVEVGAYLTYYGARLYAA